MGSNVKKSFVGKGMSKQPIRHHENLTTPKNFENRFFRTSIPSQIRIRSQTVLGYSSTFNHTQPLKYLTLYFYLQCKTFLDFL